MKIFYFSILIFLFHITCTAQKVTNVKADFIRISQDLLYAARVGDSTTDFVDALANADYNELVSQLNNDNKKKTFFINLYNAYIIVLLKKDIKQYENRSKFFRSKSIELAGRKISLEKIEHGYLRKSEWKLGLGYIKTWLPSKMEKQLRVAQQDYRIHFALNCGANGCPAIAFYEAENIEQQLQLAEEVFIKNECKKIDGKTVEVSSIFKWFKGDFGGKKGIVALLKKYKVIDENTSKIKITYRKYDWNLNLEKFR